MVIGVGLPRRLAAYAACGSLAATALAAAGPTLAQTAAPATAVTAPVTDAADPERLALARELFTTMRLDANLRGVFASVFKSMGDQMPAGAAADKAQAFLRSFSTAFEANFPDMIDAMAQLYARNLSTQELQDSLTFYRSPSGQAILTKMPAMMRDALPISLRLMPKIAAAAEADYCARQTCGETEHAVFARLRAAGRGPTS